LKKGGYMWFDQAPCEVRVEWGRRGAREAAERGDIVIIVDVLSFSTTVVTALEHGARIYPYPPHLHGNDYAEKIGAEYILGRAEAAKIGTPTLSPVSFNQAHSHKKYVVSSLNGAYCTWIASKVPALLVGSFLNASSVASVANQLRSQTHSNITVVPCGEQWNDVRDKEDSLRPALEDYLGSGAILSYLDGNLSPEAQVCAGAYNQSKTKIKELIWECGSGRELRDRGYGKDVRFSSQLNIFQTVPILTKDHFVAAPFR
jgi:2-phosphosulfolactate phosphatase